jgi:hypothetical protein
MRRSHLPSTMLSWIDARSITSMSKLSRNIWRRASLPGRSLSSGSRLATFAWPVYATGLRARIRCPVALLVVASSEAVARWAARPIELTGGTRFAPLVLGPSAVPVVTDQSTAKADPELAVFSAMAHGQDADTERSLFITDLVLAPDGWPWSSTVPSSTY